MCTTALASLEIDRNVPEVHWLRPGAAAAMTTLTSFAETRFVALYCIEYSYIILGYVL